MTKGLRPLYNLIKCASLIPLQPFVSFLRGQCGPVRGRVSPRLRLPPRVLTSPVTPDSGTRSGERRGRHRSARASPHQTFGCLWREPFSGTHRECGLHHGIDFDLAQTLEDSSLHVVVAETDRCRFLIFGNQQISKGIGAVCHFVFSFEDFYHCQSHCAM